MRIEEKRRILSYLESHNDGSDAARELVTMMKNQVCYADTESHSVCPEDLHNLDGCELGDLLREKLGKGPDEDYTADDCQRVADAMTENMSDEFSETLDCAIRYEM